MREASRGKRLFVVFYLIVLHAMAAYLIADKVFTRYVYAPEAIPTAAPRVETAQVDKIPSPTPTPEQNLNTEIANANREPLAPIPAPPRRKEGLIVPVAGVRAEQLIDSFSDARSNGRVHDAIDILAPVGTPVLAVADGEIVKFFDSVPGGITIYQFSVDRKFVYYYGHLQRRADGINVGDLVTQGQEIGYVGDTGNAGKGNYHLHFSIAAVTDPKQYWKGTYINPYPLLRQ
ncbi:MAG: M23 family metallopeptidase [Pyrinomonadaceae bacterium]